MKKAKAWKLNKIIKILILTLKLNWLKRREDKWSTIIYNPELKYGESFHLTVRKQSQSKKNKEKREKTNPKDLLHWTYKSKHCAFNDNLRKELGIDKDEIIQWALDFQEKFNLIEFKKEEIITEIKELYKEISEEETNDLNKMISKLLKAKEDETEKSISLKNSKSINKIKSKNNLDIKEELIKNLEEEKETLESKYSESIINEND